MVTSRATALLRTGAESERATFLELFFDLVFVFALTRVSQQVVVHTVAPRPMPLSGVGQPLLLLLVVVTMLGTLFMAVAVPQAFGIRGMVFAGSYVAVNLGRGLFFGLAPHRAQRRAMRGLFWFGLSAGPWIAGALVHPVHTRAALWSVAVGIDYLGVALGAPTPGLGRLASEESPVVAEHLSERYRQFFIVALGELILGIGLNYSRKNFEAERTIALLLSFATIVLIWRIYIYRAGEMLAAAIAAARNPARLVMLTSLAHLLMVIAVVLISAGDDLVISNPVQRTDPRWVVAILGGPALFLIGRAIFEYVVSARVSKARLIGVATLAAVSPALVPRPPHVAAIPPVVVLAGVAIADGVRARRHPLSAPAVPGG